MNKIYTIGYTGKTAEEFFTLLQKSSANKIIDVRLHNTSQLAGFSKQNDLQFFLKKILNWDYYTAPILAPSEDILFNYKHKKITWKDYEIQYFDLLNKRKNEILNLMKKIPFESSVLLCSEKLPDCCHRRLAAEYLNKLSNNNFEIIHLF